MEETIQYAIPIITNITRYFLFAGIPFLVFYILFPKLFSKAKIQDRWAKHKDFIREILHSMQSSITIGLVGVLFLLTPLREYTRVYSYISEYPIWWVPVSILIALVLHDTYFYWMHRTVHHPKIYKKVHFVHHQSINPSPWASFSFHISEAVVEALVLPVIICLLPMHPLSLALFGLLSFIINVYGHLGFEIAPKWFRHSFLFEIVNTSVHHNLHHSKFKGNYGLYFRVWDRLMGTENPDYVKEYDRIQARRFEKVSESSLALQPS